MKTTSDKAIDVAVKIVAILLYIVILGSIAVTAAVLSHFILSLFLSGTLLIVVAIAAGLGATALYYFHG